MISIISPAKSLDFESKDPQYIVNTRLRLGIETKEIITELKGLQVQQLKQLMNISDNLAELNFYRNKLLGKKSKKAPKRSAIYAFNGDVYLGLDAKSLKESDINFAQNHIRILSGLYGVLRPLDQIQAYRLEMGIKLKVNGSSNLYQFWRDKVSKILNKDLKYTKSNYLINLASEEYSKVVNEKKLKATIIKIDFKERRGDKLMTIGFNAKKARGKMARLIAQNSINSPEELKGLSIDGYIFENDLSLDQRFVFVK